MYDFPVHDCTQEQNSRPTTQMAVSVKKDGNVTSHLSSLLAWLCLRTSQRCVELGSSLLSKKVP